MPAILAVGSDYFMKPLYPLFGDELGYDDFPEGFVTLTKDELPPEFTTYNAPFMIDEEDIDLPNFRNKPLGPDPDTEIDPGLLPPPLDDDAEEDGIKASDFDFHFDDGVGKEFGGDFAEEEDDEYELEHAMDDEAVPDAIPDEDETAIDADGVVPPPDDEEVIPEDVDIDD